VKNIAGRVCGTLVALCIALPLWSADVAVLKSTDAPAWRPAIDALKRVAVGHTVTEYDLKGERTEALRLLAEIKTRPHILVALGALAVQAAREGAPELALVYGFVPDPAQAGVLNIPGITGVATSTPVRNQLAAFRMVNPRGVRIGVLHSEAVTKQVEEAVQAAGVVRLMVVPRKVASEKDVPEGLRALLKGSEAVDALWLPADPVLLGEDTRRLLLTEATRAGKPVYAFSEAIVAEGALASNAPDVVSTGEQLGELVARAAAGESAGRSDVLVPRASLAINKKVADKLKVEIPVTTLAAAKVY
jgi:ABC-type uncharacterized transport system substrate-binding protein